jgi:hypothetical protein
MQSMLQRITRFTIGMLRICDVASIADFFHPIRMELFELHCLSHRHAIWILLHFSRSSWMLGDSCHFFCAPCHVRMVIRYLSKMANVSNLWCFLLDRMLAYRLCTNHRSCIGLDRDFLFDHVLFTLLGDCQMYFTWHGGCDCYFGMWMDALQHTKTSARNVTEVRFRSTR